MLLEDVTNNDSALEANFGDFQLLVFPSSLLPLRSQRKHFFGFNKLSFFTRFPGKISVFLVPKLNVFYRLEFSPVFLGRL